MPNEIETEKRKRGFVSHLFTWVAAVFCLLAIYVLSMGPVMKVSFAGYLPNRFLAAYQPLAVIASHSTIVHQFLIWYLDEIWNVHAPEKSGIEFPN
jgi:hypothetical protein